MAPPIQPHHPTSTEPQKLILPPAYEVEPSTDDKCDALLAFCERANELKRALCQSSPPKGSDLSDYVERLQAIKTGGEAGGTPETVAHDLATLVTTRLNCLPNAEDSQYWLTATSALAAATRETMPKLSSTLSSAQSRIIAQQAESTVPYPLRYS